MSKKSAQEDYKKWRRQMSPYVDNNKHHSFKKINEVDTFNGNGFYSNVNVHNTYKELILQEIIP